MIKWSDIPSVLSLIPFPFNRQLLTCFVHTHPSDLTPTESNSRRNITRDLAKRFHMRSTSSLDNPLSMPHH